MRQTDWCTSVLARALTAHENAAQSIVMNCGSLSIKVRIGRKSGGEAGKAHHTRMIKILLGPSTRPGARQEKNAIARGHKRAFDSSLSWSCRARERADGLCWERRWPTIRVLMTKNATNIRYSCTKPNTQSMGSCELKGPHKIFTVWKRNWKWLGFRNHKPPLGYFWHVTQHAWNQIPRLFLGWRNDDCLIVWLFFRGK